MKYNITLNQPAMIEYNLNVAKFVILDVLSVAPTWCNPVVKENEVYFWVARQKISEELKAFDYKPNTIFKYLKELNTLGFIDYIKDGKKDLIRLTNKGKSIFTAMLEKNPDYYVGKKSEESLEKNPTYNNTNNHNNTSYNNTVHHSEVEHLEPSLNSLTTTLTTTIVTDDENNYPMRIANYLKNNILRVNPTFKDLNAKLWAKDIELAIRIDKRTPEQLKECIDWIYSGKGNSSFWISNILSGKKLRQKFDTINMQAISYNKNNQQGKVDIEDIYSKGLTATEVIAEMIRREKEQ